MLFIALAAAAFALHPGQAIRIDLALAPGLAERIVKRWNGNVLRAALAQQLAQAGVAVAGNAGLARLHITITSFDKGAAIGAGQSAHLEAEVQLHPVDGPPLPVRTVRCDGKGSLSLDSTPGSRNRQAIQQCLNMLAVAIAGPLTGSDQTVIVR